MGDLAIHGEAQGFRTPALDFEGWTALESGQFFEVSRERQWKSW